MEWNLSAEHVKLESTDHVEEHVGGGSIAGSRHIYLLLSVWRPLCDYLSPLSRSFFFFFLFFTLTLHVEAIFQSAERFISESNNQ